MYPSATAVKRWLSYLVALGPLACVGNEPTLPSEEHTVASAERIGPIDGNPECVGSATVLCPGESIQAKVDAAPAGTGFTLKRGVYRLQSITPKSGDSFMGEPGALLSGATTLTGWTPAGATWYAGGQTQEGHWYGWPAARNPELYCERGYPRCDLPEDLWMNDVRKHHVATLGDVGPGKWFFDYAADRIYVGDDPTDKTVETSVVEYAIANPAAANVTVQGLIVEKYASASGGAIGGQANLAGPGWVVQDNEVRSNHALGIVGSNIMQARRNYLHHNGQYGLGAQFSLVEDNEIAYNNQAGYSMQWDGGGAKFTFTNGLIVRGNYVHHNKGNGLWTDIDNVNTLYENNTVEDNDQVGIFHEISWNAVIRNNIIRRNGASHAGVYAANVGILVSTSSGVEIYGNTVEDNSGGGIHGVSYSRTPPPGGGGWVLQNLWVHDNTILISQGYAAGIGNFGGLDVTSGYNNHFDRNSYRVPASLIEPFVWTPLTSPPQTWAEWQATGNDTGGTLTTY